MQADELERYKQILIQMRNSSREEGNRMIEVVLSDAEAAGEHDQRVSESVDKELALEQTEEDRHQAVLAALQRIEQQKFGQCTRCGSEIPRTRLELLPFTPYCVDCAFASSS